MPEWSAILKEHGPTAWRTAYRILGNRADADDCLQEACLAAVQFTRRYAVHHWRGLLVHLVTARAVDRLRERRRRPEGQAADWGTVAGQTPLPSQAAEEAEFAERLRAALGCLAPSQAAAFCLHCLTGGATRRLPATCPCPRTPWEYTSTGRADAFVNSWLPLTDELYPTTRSGTRRRSRDRTPSTGRPPGPRRGGPPEGSHPRRAV